MNAGESSPDAHGERRSFLVRFTASLMGGVVAMFPVAVGLGVAMDPLCRRRQAPTDGEAESDEKKFVPICPLDALPADGVPRSFPVITDVVDAWTRAANERIGMVFLIHKALPAGPKVTAFNAECPHLGCFVDYDQADGKFECPCHESGFDTTGKQLFGPSRRGLDPLKVKLETRDGQTQVWVAFQKFQKGIEERKAAE